MKKLVCLALFMFIMLFAVSAFAGTQDAETVGNVDEPTSTLVTIKPSIQMETPGMLKLTITWTDPILRFTEKTVITNDGDVTYYELKYHGTNASFDVPLMITNNSTAGGDEDNFSGYVDISASASLSFVPNYPHNDFNCQNIMIRLTPDTSNTRVRIPNDAGNNNANVNTDFVLSYMNKPVDANTATSDIITTPPVQSSDMSNRLSTQILFTIHMLSNADIGNP